MANSIALAQNFAPLLDSAYKKFSLTSPLEVQDEFVRNFDDAGTVQLMSMVLDGLGDYSRSTGFPDGDVTVTWTPYTIDNDRGRSFQVDAMDDAEAKNKVFVEVAREFIKQHVIPEVDATRFAKMAASGDTTVNADLADGDAALAAIDVAIATLDDAEVPMENRWLFVSATTYSQLKNAGKVVREFSVDGNGNRVVERDFETLDGMPVVRVPAGRFSTAVTLGSNGFTKSGTDINFQLVHAPAVKAITRHAKVRIFGADVNQAADADKYQYRIYHDLIAPANKTAGIYTHAKTA